MEVVCYIWDQCFIGATISGFQCLKYFAASWFLILKHQLLICHSVSPYDYCIAGNFHQFCCLLSLARFFYAKCLSCVNDHIEDMATLMKIFA